jgi:hypothetical protein
MTYCDECKQRLPIDPEIRQYDPRTKRWLTPICQGCPHEEDNRQEKIMAKLKDDIENLEAITAQPGKLPREYHKQMQELQGQIVFVQNKLNAALDRGKKKATAPEGIKSTYKGLKIGP